MVAIGKFYFCFTSNFFINYLYTYIVLIYDTDSYKSVYCPCGLHPWSLSQRPYTRVVKYLWRYLSKHIFLARPLKVIFNKGPYESLISSHHLSSPLLFKPWFDIMIHLSLNLTLRFIWIHLLRLWIYDS